jgi:hypothetical protein
MSGAAPQAADNLPDALAAFLRVRLDPLSPAEAAVVADALASAFRLGAAWSAQHGLLMMTNAVASTQPLHIALVSVIEGLALISQQALAADAQPIH